MKREKKRQVVIIAGFGGSGSGAVIDLLSEIDVFKKSKTELRLLVDPDGIMNLESNLINNWSPYQSDSSIKKFRRLVKILSKKYRLPYFGVNHIKKINKEFINLSNEYLDKLISFSYDGMWFGLNNSRWLISIIIKKILGLNLFNFYKPIYISFKKDTFINITKDYLEKLLNSNIDDEKIKYIIVDEGYASLHPGRVLKYFNSAKMIIVHRDPRDIFVGALENDFYFIPHEIKAFVKWYRCLQEQTYLYPNTDNKILRIQFEDLVFKYNETIKIILEFLNVKNYKHVLKKKHFDPNISIKNIGIWKGYKKQHEIESIYNNLKEYCYKH